MKSQNYHLKNYTENTDVMLLTSSQNTRNLKT